MSLEAIRRAVEAHAAAHWAETPLAWDNLTYDAAARGPWLRVSVSGSTGRQVTLGAPEGRIFRRRGQVLLQLFVPTMPGETHNGVEIADVAAGLPVALSMAFVGNAVLVSNNMDEIKRIIDLQAGEGDSGLFASLDPPMDAKQPRYSVFMVKTKLYTDVILPLTMLFGGVPDEADMVLGQISGKISELRAVSEMRDAWAVSAVSFMFK